MSQLPPLPLLDVPPEAAHRVVLLRDVPAGELLIHEIYLSVQGESTFAGLPCVFVRTSVCDSRCKWCFVPETPVLMADWSWKAIGEVRPGDQLIATERPDMPRQRRKVAVTTVTDCHVREAETVVVNGNVRCTPDHKFWSTGYGADNRRSAHEGWREVSRLVGFRTQFLADPRRSDTREYERGWLAGMADGDGCFWTLEHRRGSRRFRLAQKEPVLLDRFAQFASRAGVSLHEAPHIHTGIAGKSAMRAVWLTRDTATRNFERWLSDDVDSDSWRFGYLGGILDAEGSLSQRVLRIAQDRDVNPRTWGRIRRVLVALGVGFSEESAGFYVHRSRGELWRILANARPAKPRIRRAACESSPYHTRVIESVVPTGRREPVITLTTTLGCYVAAGFVVKNCDTPHAFTQGERMSRADVLARALAFDCPLVEITGGEPLLQADVIPLMTELCAAGKTVLLETSGAHDVSAVDPRVHVIMDLKCPDSGEGHRNRWANLDLLKPTDQIKFVIASRRDWDWAATAIREHRLDERFICLTSTVFGAVRPVELVTWLLESGLFRVRVQLQMHKYIWEPTRRGV